MRTGSSFDLEFRIRMQDGSYRWFRTRGRSVLRTGRQAAAHGRLADRHHGSQADRSAGLRGEGKGASHPGFDRRCRVITVDTSGRVEFLNPVAERLTGWRNEDARQVSRVDRLFRDG